MTASVSAALTTDSVSCWDELMSSSRMILFLTILKYNFDKRGY